MVAAMHAMQADGGHALIPHADDGIGRKHGRAPRARATSDPQ